jgi:hypothetical protein
MPTYNKDFIVTVPTIPTIAETVDTKTLPNYQINVPAIPTIEETVDTKTLPNYQINVPAIPTIEETVAVVPVTNADYVFLHDADVGYTAYTNEAKEATANDVPLLPAVIGANDALYIGFVKELPGVVKINVTTAGAGTYTLAFEYWNGAWTALTVVGEVKNDKYKVAEISMLAWIVPSDAVLVTINGGQAYWFRLRYVSGTMTTRPLAGQIWLDVIASSGINTMLWAANF